MTDPITETSAGDTLRKLEARTRVAIGKINDRLTHLEESIAASEEGMEFIRKAYARVQVLGAQLDDAIPRMTRAEAELGRANALIDGLWKLVGENAGSIVKLRELLNAMPDLQEDRGRQS